MVRPRTRTNQIPQEPDLENIVATLQLQLLEQQQEKNRFREQIARLNQILRANEVPLQDNPIPPVAPYISEVHQGIPWNHEVPLAPARMQAILPMAREDLLYKRFRRMKAPKFEGFMDPMEVDNQLIDIHVILEFMGLTEQEKVICASFALKKDARHWWMTVQSCRKYCTHELAGFCD